AERLQPLLFPASSCPAMPEKTVQEGNEITFECSLRGDDMGNYYMAWYRQGPWGGTLEWICRENSAYGEGFRDRFRGSVDEFMKRVTLQVLAAKQGDAATYYCIGSTTLDQLCSRVNQKPADGEDISQHFFLAAAPWGTSQAMAGAGNIPLAWWH
uniref:Ig-like domain-containing protein n=1 Tax=Zosterops lateralis melanops TaxID=1220523 RepID=A0A8D2PK83_ZOSLA